MVIVKIQLKLFMTQSLKPLNVIMHEHFVENVINLIIYIIKNFFS